MSALYFRCKFFWVIFSVHFLIMQDDFLEALRNSFFFIYISVLLSWCLVSGSLQFSNTVELEIKAYRLQQFDFISISRGSRAWKGEIFHKYLFYYYSMRHILHNYLYLFCFFILSFFVHCKGPFGISYWLVIGIGYEIIVTSWRLSFFFFFHLFLPLLFFYSLRWIYLLF